MGVVSPARERAYLQAFFGARCFDSCSRAIAASSKDAYEAAVATVNAGSCGAYQQQGCPAPIVPPCVPPSEPRCNAGVCE